MRSQGPIIHRLTLTTAISSVLALISVIGLVVVYLLSITDIQVARQKSAFDTCVILDALIDKSASGNQRAPVYDSQHRLIGYAVFGGNARAERKLVAAFINRVGLRDCHVYARNVRSGHLRTPSQPPRRALSVH